MRGVWAVALNSFRESSRNRIFYGLLATAILFILSSLLVANLTVPEARTRVLLNYGAFSISLFGVVIAIVMGVIQVHKEIDKKTVFSILTRPLSRGSFIVGKFVGMALILLVALLVLAAVWVAALLIDAALQRGVLTTVEIAPQLAIIPGVLLLIFVEQLVIASFAVFFSSFSSPILGGVFTVGFFFLGRSVSFLLQLAERGKGVMKSPLAKSLARAFSAIFPDLSSFNLSQELVQAVKVPALYLWHATAYGACYVVIFLIASIFLFNRREFA
ncbi:MAG: ABC transporter permease [Myxococcales bacterium]|nr:ABC transporter permease [Myxococcales bacterium]